MAVDYFDGPLFPGTFWLVLYAPMVSWNEPVALKIVFHNFDGNYGAFVPSVPTVPSVHAHLPWVHVKCIF